MALNIWDFSRIRFSNVTGPALPRRQQLEIDGFYGVDLGDRIRITVQPAIVQTTSVLSERSGTQNGELVTTMGKYVAGDFAGLTFRYVDGVTSGANGHTIINTADGRGQYQAQDPQHFGYMNPRWFGADRTGVSDSTSAIQAAITAAVAAGIKRVFIPPGTYLVCPTSSSNGITVPSAFEVYGAGALASRLKITANTSSGGGPVDGGAQTVIYGLGLSIVIHDLGIFTADANLADPRSPLSLTSQRHGIVLEGFDMLIQNVNIYGTSGSGIRSIGSSFQCTIDNAVVSNTGNWCMWLTGDNTWKVFGGSMEAPPENMGGLWVENGHISIEKLNGLFTSYAYPGLPGGFVASGTRVMKLGAQATITTCNFEDFAYCGIEVTTNIAPVVQGCVFLPEANKVVRAVICTGISIPALWENNNRLFPPPGTGGWGDPDTAIIDNYEFQANDAGSKVPFIFVGTTYTGCKNKTSGVAMNIGLLDTAAVGLGRYAPSFNALKVSELYYGQNNLAATGNLAPGLNFCDTSSAGFTAHLPNPLATGGAGDQVDVFIMKGANTLTCDVTGGYPIYDGAGGAALTFGITGLHKSVRFVRGTGQYLGADTLGWYIASKNY